MGCFWYGCVIVFLGMKIGRLVDLGLFCRGLMSVHSCGEKKGLLL